MIPRKTVEISSSTGAINIKAKYGSVAVAIEAPNGDIAFTALTELNQLGTQETSSWQTAGVPDGKTVYGKFNYVIVSSGDCWLHLE